jgi:hypothetical protein
MNEEEAAIRSIASDYLAAVVRSRRAVDRILACVADIAERDEGCARAIAAHPEALAALARCASAAPWLLRAAGSRGPARVASRPPKEPNRAPGRKTRRSGSGGRKR